MSVFDMVGHLYGGLFFCLRLMLFCLKGIIFANSIIFPGGTILDIIGFC